MKYIELKCNYCGESVFRSKQKITQTKIKGYNNVYCNNKCQHSKTKEDTIAEFEIRKTIRCGLCKEEKHFSNFNKNKTQTIGYQTICKDCSRERSRKYYKDNPQTHKNNVSKNNKIQSDRLNLFIIDFLIKNPCVDCGENDIRTLHFDHIIPEEKSHNISDMKRCRMNEEKIMKEINKCEVRCANCHAKRTAEQFNWFKHLYLSS